jgi:hypothetical protein
LAADARGRTTASRCGASKLPLALLLAVAAGLARAESPDAAGDPAWSVGVARLQNALQTVGGESYRPVQTSVVLARRLDGGAHARFGEEHRALDLPAVDGVPADTNGHVHRLGFGWGRDTQARRYDLAAGLAVSSNALKHPGDLDLDDVRFAGVIEQRAGAWRLAVRVDDRFGRGLVYLAVTRVVQPAPGHELQIGLPDASWRWNLAPRWRVGLAIGPDGGRWRVRDRELQRESIVRQSLWRAAWSVQWRPLAAVAVDARIGWAFASALEYRLAGGRAVRVEPPDTPFFGVAVGGRF